MPCDSGRVGTGYTVWIERSYEHAFIVAVEQASRALNRPPDRDRWYVLAVMTVVYALNIADRFSISTLIEPIRLELRLTDSGIAFLTGVALALFYVTIGIPIALLADKANRRNILAIALALWSAMTALCGLAQNYWQLLLARFGVGIGEAGGTPPATSILADKFPAGEAPDGTDHFCPRRVPGSVARLLGRRRRSRQGRLAGRLSGVGHSRTGCCADRLVHRT